MKKVFILLICLIFLLGAENKDTRILSTSGEGLSEATPDTVIINLGVQREGLTAEEAQAALRKALANVLEALKPLDLPNESIKTAGYSLYPLYKQRKDASGGTYQTDEIDRYRTYIRLSIELYQVQQAGKITDTAIKAGVNRVEDIAFTLKDDTAAKNEALKAAIISAQNKARLLAEKFNVELLSPIEIRETEIFSARSMMQNTQMIMNDAAAAGFNLPESKVKMNARINVTYEIAPKRTPPVPEPAAPASPLNVGNNPGSSY